MFKKSLITAAAIVALTISGAAMAGTWAPTTVTATPPIFATELFGSGTEVISPTTAIYTMATTPGAGASFLVDVTLSGATWGAALTSGSLVFTQVGTTGVVTVFLVSGGGLLSSVAQFRVDVSGAIETNDTFTLTYTMTGAGAGGAKLGIALADGLGPVDTAGVSAAVSASAAGTTGATSATGAPGFINVATGSTLFTGAVTTKSMSLGTVTIANGTGGANEDDGTTAWVTAAGDAVATTGSIIVTGDFAASLGVDTDADGNAGEGEGVTLTGCLTANATTLTATTATFTLTNANIVTALGAACTITMVVDGTTQIAESPTSVVVNVDFTDTGYADLSKTGALATVSKNGATVMVNLMLTPGGAFSNFVRISNTSGVTGKVIVTLWNDAGDAVTFDLSTVAGETGTLAGQSSSGLIALQALFDAAVAADATFAHNSGKLRGRFEGEFSSITADSITLSTDSTTFSTF